MRATDIVGYTYEADIYCPHCIIGQLPTGTGGDFDGWALASGIRMSTEKNLDEIALAFGFDRHDENTFDSGEFPKVIFCSDISEGDPCGNCGCSLI